MSSRDLTYAGWRSRRAAAVTRVPRLDAGLPPHRRRRLRSVAEARFLRQIGTPEELIGPIGSDEEVAGQTAQLIAFARRLRVAARR